MSAWWLLSLIPVFFLGCAIGHTIGITAVRGGEHRKNGLGLLPVNADTAAQAIERMPRQDQIIIGTAIVETMNPSELTDLVEYFANQRIPGAAAKMVNPGAMTKQRATQAIQARRRDIDLD